MIFYEPLSQARLPHGLTMTLIEARIIGRETYP